MRKVVTVVFADLVGSTAFGERVDPEAARDAMARYFRMIQDVIDAHAGTVAKFVGDGVMAVFGIPEVAEDDADRAVAAGLALQREFEAIRTHIHDRYHVEVGLRVGINTGEVVIADDDADIVGDALNTAARLEAACTPGRVLVGEDTWRLTRSHVTYEVLGEVTVKGKAEPVATFQVVEQAGAEDEAATPFVGRDVELDQLRRVLAEASEERTAKLVTVIGAPGVGKTRLALELARAQGDTLRWFDLRCERSGTATFAPIAELLRKIADISSDARPEEATAAIDAFVGHDVADRDRVVELLGSFVGAAAPRSTEEMFFAARRLLELVAHGQRALVVVDDIQWAEPLFLDLLEHLAEWVRDAPLLIVALARPEIREIRPALSEVSRRVSAVLSVEGLDASATERLAAQLLGVDALPVELTDRLPASTEGNPLFVRELMRMMVDDGVVTRTETGWEMAVDPDAVQVPPTIQSLLSTRVERMPADERRLVELAAVVGSEFPLGAVAALVDDAERGQVQAAIDRLGRKEIVEPTGAYWGDEPVFRFHHVLIRDAAYRRLLKRARADLHRQVGDWTERTASTLVGEHEPTIAFHYEQCHGYRSELGLLDAETAEVGDRAATLLRSAAERALERDDLSSAGGLARRALATISADAATRADLLLLACEALLGSGDVAGGEETLHQLDEVAAADARLQAWSACFHAQLIILTSPQELSFAEASVNAAAEQLTELGDDAGVAKARQVRAGALARLGRVGDCEAELDLALTAARAADDRRRVTAVLGSAPVAALWGPSPVPRAGGRCLDVIRLLRITTGSPAVEATSVRCQAVLEALRGRFDTARSMLETSRSTGAELGLRHGLMETELYAGIVELLAGEPAAAEPHLREAYGGLGKLGIGADAGQAAAYLARALLLQGQLDEAEELAAASDALAGQNPQTLIAARSAEAEILSARGDHDAAVELAEEAVGLATGRDIIVDHARACMVLSRVRSAAGDEAGADQARVEAQRLFDLKGATVDLQAEATRPAVAADEHGADSVGPRRARLPRTNLEAMDYAEDFVFEDRRGGPAGGRRVTTRDEFVEGLRALGGVGFDEYEFQPLARRADRFVLARVVFRNGDGLEDPRIALQAMDEQGRTNRLIAFDESDLAAAATELDRLYLETLDPESAASFRGIARFMAAVNAHDIDTLSEILHPDFRTTGSGRREGRWPEQHRTGYLDRIRTMLEPGDVRIFSRIHAMTPQGAVGERETYIGDGDYLIGVIDVMLVENGQATRVVSFNTDELNDALAYFEGATSGPSDLANTASAVARDVLSAVLDGDRQRIDALLAERHVLDDRRPISDTGAIEGRGDSVDALVDLGDMISGADLRVVATRGDHLCLTSIEWDYVNWGPQRGLHLVEIDETGRQTHTVNFRSADLADAVAELDRLYLDSLDPEPAAVFGAVAEMSRIANAGDRDALSEELATDLRAAGGDGVSVISAVDALTADGIVFRHEVVIERKHIVSSSIQVALVENGLTTRNERFDRNELDAALARFDELTSPAESPALENECSRVAGLTGLAYEAGDWDAYIEHFAEPFVYDPHHTGPRYGEMTTRAELLANMRARLEVGYVHFDGDVIAVRGETLVLRSLTLSTEAGDVEPSLLLFALDADGKIARTAVWDPDDLASASAELDRLYLETLDPERAEVFEAIAEFFRGVNAGDVDGLEDRLAPDFRFSGGAGRRGRFPEQGREEYLERIVTGTVENGDVRVITAVDVLTPDGAVFRHDNHVATSDYVISSVELALVENGRATRSISYDADQLDAARRDFDDLTAAAADPVKATSLVDNAASRAQRELSALLDGGDDAAARDLVADDVVRLDHRRSVSAEPLRGADRWIESRRALLEVGGFREPTTRTLAVRGDRLALSHVSLVNEAGTAVDLLVVVRLDDAGRIDHVLNYDPDDLAAAHAELDRLYLELLPDDLAATFAVGAAHVRAVGRRDWTEVRGQLDPALRTTDHRVVGWPGGDVDDYLARLRSLDAVAAITVIFPEIHRLSARGMLVTSISTTHDPDTQTRELWLGRMHDGVMDRAESFAADDLDAALARFETLTSSAPRVRSLAIEGLLEVRGAVLGRRWEQLSGLFDEDVVISDRRRGPAGGREVRGREDYMLGVRALFDVFDAVDVTPLATRGDHLALAVVTTTTRSGDVDHRVSVIRFSENGRMDLFVSFDPEELPAAFGELDRLYFESLGAEYVHTARVLTALRKAAGPRDADGWEALLADDFVGLDHRAVTHFPEIDRDAWLDSVRQQRELAGDGLAYATEFHELRPDGGVWTSVVRAGSVGDAGFEWHTTNLVVIRSDEITRYELFDTEDVDAALARFGELTAASGAERSLENAATEFLCELRDAFNTHDWERFGNLCADTFDYHPHHSGPRYGPLAVRDDFVGNQRARADLGYRMDFEVLAVRGDRLALTAHHWRTANDFVESLHAVLGLDEEGRLHHIATADVEDLDTAVAELDRIYAEGEGAPHRGLLANLERVRAAAGRRTPEAWNEVVAPDFVAIDHRSGFGDLVFDRAAWLESAVQAAELAGEGVAFARIYHRLDQSGAVFDSELWTRSDDGATHRWPTTSVAIFDGDRLARLEMWNEGGAEAALTRFDELTPAEHVPVATSGTARSLENHAARVAAEFNAAAFERADFDAVRALMHADATALDTRAVVGLNEVMPAETFIETLETYWTEDHGASLTANEIVGIRGEGLVVERSRLTLADGSELAVAVLTEIDEAGLITALCFFDDIGAAMIELDRRYIAGEGAPYAVVLEPNVELMRAAAARSATGWGDRLADHVEIADHRSGIKQHFDRGAWVEGIRAQGDVAGAGTAWVTQFHRLTTDGGVGAMVQRSTSPEGAQAEWVTVALSLWDAGLIVHLELFDESEVDAALERFDELAASTGESASLPGAPSNLATQTFVRMLELISSGDERWRELTAEGFVGEDRRPIADSTRHGTDGLASAVGSYRGVGMPRFEPAGILAVRGDRWMLGEVHMRSDEEIVALLAVSEVDPAGRVTRAINFEPDDVVAAVGALDELYTSTIEGEGAALVRLSNEHQRALWTQDWELLDRLIAPDFEFADRRTLSTIELDRAGYMARIAAVAGEYTYAWWCRSLERLTESDGVAVIRAFARTADGELLEWEFVGVTQMRDGRFTRFEYYDLDHFETALNRYEELRAVED